MVILVLHSYFSRYIEEKLIELAEKLENIESNRLDGTADRRGKKKTKQQRRGDQAQAQMKKKLKQYVLCASYCALAMDNEKQIWGFMQFKCSSAYREALSSGHFVKKKPVDKATHMVGNSSILFINHISCVCVILTASIINSGHV